MNLFSGKGNKLVNFEFIINIISFVFNLLSRETKIVNVDFVDFIKTLRHPCCSCIESIAGVMKVVSSILILYNYSIIDGVSRSSPNQFSNEISLLICKWNKKSA